MARHELVISNGAGGSRSKTSAVKSLSNVSQKTSTMNSGGGNTLKNIAKGMRTFRTLDTGAFGLFGGTTGGATMMLVQESVKTVSKGVDIAIDINLAKTGESVRAGNIRRIKGYILDPSKFVIEATYGEYLRDLQVSRANIKNEYYRNLTGNLTYGKQYGDK